MNNWRYICICICICLSFVVRCRLNYFALALELCAPEVKDTNTHILFGTHTLVKLIKHTREHTLDSCLCKCVCVFTMCCELSIAYGIGKLLLHYIFWVTDSLTHRQHTRSLMPALLLQHFISHPLHHHLHLPPLGRSACSHLVQFPTTFGRLKFNSPSRLQKQFACATVCACVCVLVCMCVPANSHGELDINSQVPDTCCTPIKRDRDV